MSKVGFKVTASREHDYSMEAGPMGPIGEGESLILRMTRNCPWNQCLFCPVYKGSTFSFRSVAEVTHDIDAAARISEMVEASSLELGCDGRVNREVIKRVIRSNPEIYGNVSHVSAPHNTALASLNNVVNWMLHGAKRVFLQDADALVMKPRELETCLRHLNKRFPRVETVTSYARSSTCARRTRDELAALSAAGLSRLLVGIESGDDGVLRSMKKGVTMAQHIDGGRKAIDAGIDLVAFVMPGLAGDDPAASGRHVAATIEVLNALRPAEVRVRSLAVIEGSPLYERATSGKFAGPTDERMIREIQTLIEGLEFDCVFETLQLTNVLFNVRCRLSSEKQKLLALIARYQAAPRHQRLRFRLSRYIHGGYLSCVEGWGRLDQDLADLITEAAAAVERGFPDAEEQVDAAVFGIKSKGIP